jgi:hypothetical protein
MRKKHNNKLVELLGWYGTVAIIGAYALLSFAIIKQDSLLYQVLNLTGAVGILIETYTKKDFQPAVLNIIWSIIALIAIFQILF